MLGDMARSIRRYFETEHDALEFLLEIEDTLLIDEPGSPVVIGT